ncbi:hypothetical protein DOT_4463 [Desulfosporosinus sp. OT]|nr:hypothetical protein DOT_4463 [Desulfosporosinus sp. OT]
MNKGMEINTQNFLIVHFFNIICLIKFSQRRFFNIIREFILK